MPPRSAEREVETVTINGATFKGAQGDMVAARGRGRAGGPGAARRGVGCPRTHPSALPPSRRLRHHQVRGRPALRARGARGREEAGRGREARPSTPVDPPHPLSRPLQIARIKRFWQPAEPVKVTADNTTLEVTWFYRPEE